MKIYERRFSVIRVAVTYVEHAKRKTVAALDVLYTFSVKEEPCTVSVAKSLASPVLLMTTYFNKRFIRPSLKINVIIKLY